VRAEYLLATDFRRSGNESLARAHYQQVETLLEETRKESNSDKVLARADFAGMLAEAKQRMAK
jgi:hypothetical protein